jgi:hypothetical protein
LGSDRNFGLGWQSSGLLSLTLDEEVLLALVQSLRSEPLNDWRGIDVAVARGEVKFEVVLLIF